MAMNRKYLSLIYFMVFLYSCSTQESGRIPIIVDTDANNELDDQHALAYTFFNDGVFDIKGITVNATFGGGDVEEQYGEGKRVMQLCNVWERYPLKKGADGAFDQIVSQVHAANFDGQEAVDFIIQEALQIEGEPLILIPIGKLTNIALALEKAPEIKEKVRIVWLGSNYPDPGEYNLENDIGAMNYILEQQVPFGIVTVRYGTSTGSDAVRVTPHEVREKMKDLGPEVSPVTGRHGGTFTNFGDYSISLFSNINLSGDPPSRALYDLVALAVVKNPSWGQYRTIPAPQMQDSLWWERPDNERQVVIWENFDANAILEDFYRSLGRTE